MSDPANGEGLLGTAAPAADDDAFEDLDPLPCALDHLGVHLDGVARDQGRNVLALGLSFQQVDDVGHGVQGYHPDSRLPLVVEQVRAATASPFGSLGAAPALDLRMVARAQHLGNGMPFEFGGAGVVRILEEMLVEGLVLR